MYITIFSLVFFCHVFGHDYCFICHLTKIPETRRKKTKSRPRKVESSNAVSNNNKNYGNQMRLPALLALVLDTFED